MNKEIEELLHNNVENIQKKKQERKEIFESIKEKVYRVAKANSKKINDKILQSMLSIFYDRLGKGYELSVSMQSLLLRKERDELKSYVLDKTNIKLMDFLKSTNDKAENEIHFFENGRKGELVPFIYEKNLYEKLGIKLQNTFSSDSDMFKVDVDVFVERLEKIANGEIKVRNKNRLKVIKEYCEDILEKYDIIKRFNEMSKTNAKLIYLSIYKELLNHYNNMTIHSSDYRIEFYIECIDVTDEKPIFNIDLLNSYLDLKINISNKVLLAPYKQGEEIIYLPIIADDLSILYYNDKAFKAEIFCGMISIKSSQLKLEEAVLQTEESYQRKLITGEQK